MKTFNWWYACFFVLGGIAMVAAQNLLFVNATAQQPPGATLPPPTRVQSDGRGTTEEFADGTVIERLKDGRILQTVNVPTTTLERRPDGSYVQRQVITPDSVTVFLGGGPATDPETARLLQEELQATQEAQKLWSEFHAADSDGDKEKIKTQLRERLTAIFDLQQKRRAGEVAKIEERLAKLKATMSKRDAAKQEIVDRRLDVLTGGIDELGWEDTFRGPGANAANRAPGYDPYGRPATTVPLTAPPVGPPGGGAFPPTIPRPGAVLPAPVDVPAVPALPGLTPAPADPAATDASPLTPTLVPVAPRR